MDVLIVDDEPLARQRLERMLDELDGYRVVASVASAAAARDAIFAHDPDIVLLDVQMPGEDGLSAAHAMSDLDDPPAIIFCTAFDRYALDAFATPATGYLLKPVKPEKLAEALAKAAQVNKVQRAQFDRSTLSDADTKAHIAAKTHKGIELIPFACVRYFLADQKYVTVYHTGGEHLLDTPLKELEETFAGRLLRIHRNALVSVAHIEALERLADGGYCVRLVDMTDRPAVSRRHASQVKAVLQHL